MEENKNQEQPKKELAPDGRERVITENIPKEYVEIIDGKKKERQQLLNTFLQVSFQIAQAQKAQQELVNKLADVDQSFKGKLEWIMQKMKLHKMRDRNWRYDGRENFIGVYNPPKPKKEKK